MSIILPYIRMKSVSLIFFLTFLAARGSPRGQNRQIVIETCSPDQYGSYEYNIAIYLDEKCFSDFLLADLWPPGGQKEVKNGR